MSEETAKYLWVSLRGSPTALELDQIPESGAFLKSSYDSLSDPQGSQEHVLDTLLAGYRRTSYGQRHSASQVSSIEDFRRNFPASDYDSFVPLLDAVAEGRHEELLPEPVRGWVMTRGTTGLPKLFPITDTHLRQIIVCGSRAVLNYASSEGKARLYKRPVLNLCFPSDVGQIKVGGRELSSYGYSSGTYAKLATGFGNFRLVPSQGDIDALGTGDDDVWTRRFDLIFKEAKGLDIGSLIGVTPIMMSFAKYMRRHHGLSPREIWDIDALFCTSVPKIQVKYAPYLRRFYGNADVREIYSATEGVFGQQLNESPCISPNYDSYLFEVRTRNGFRMLHELEKGEWGRLIISSCIFPRYCIGDLVESYGGNFFRILGRETTATILEHTLYRAMAWWLY